MAWCGRLAVAPKLGPEWDDSQLKTKGHVHHLPGVPIAAELDRGAIQKRRRGCEAEPNNVTERARGETRGVTGWRSVVGYRTEWKGWPEAPMKTQRQRGGPGMENKHPGPLDFFSLWNRLAGSPESKLFPWMLEGTTMKNGEPFRGCTPILSSSSLYSEGSCGMPFHFLMIPLRR